VSERAFAQRAKRHAVRQLAGARARPHPEAGSGARAFAPPRSGIDFLDSGAVHAAAARGTQGAGGALPHLERIQRSFGRHDVGGIRAYTGAAATEAAFAMGASAFAWGDKVGFAGKPGLRTAAHEAAHVVQQRAGVHLKSGVGQAGDRYEQQADAVAERVAQGRSAEGLLGAPAAAGAAAAPAVQRSVGFEFELRADDWNIWRRGEEEGEESVPAKGTPVIFGRDFTLQAEYSGEDKAVAELVTNDPGLQTRHQFERSLKDMQKLGRKLNEKKSNQTYGARDFGFLADPDFLMEKKGAAAIGGAVLQATAGVPLASIPALFKNLEAFVPKSEEYQQARSRAEEVGESVGAGREFTGLMTLLHLYLSDLQGSLPTQNYVKGLVKVMARTDFHAMFELMPEKDQTYVKEHMDAWIREMLSAHEQKGEEEDETVPLSGEGPLVSPIITDPDSTDPTMAITTTRESWLRNLPARDLLSFEGRPEVVTDVQVFPSRTRKEISNEILALGEKGKKPSKKLQDEYLLSQSTKLERFGKPSKAKKPFWAKNQEKQRKAIENLYMGLGSLGKRMDFIQYRHEPVDEEAPVNPDNYTGAPIIEIRNPPNAGAVDNWLHAASQIWFAVAEAIEFPRGRGSKKKPKLKQKYEHVLTPKQLELQAKAKERAKALQDRIDLLDEETD
jgi:hypothetical protein